MSVAPPLGKELASVDKKTRDDAVRRLREFLSTTGDKPMAPLEMEKLWKAIFYCFWLSDKPLIQQELSSSLADLLLVIPTADESFRFLSGFWRTIVREWPRLDYLRIDKYYMLVRRFVNASFRLLIREKWSKEALDQYTAVIAGPGGPLNPEDRKIPTSLAYHLADIYNEELNKTMSSSESLPVPLVPLLVPFFQFNALQPSPTTHNRLHESLFTPIFSALLIHSNPDLVQNYRSTGSAPTLSPRDLDGTRRKRARIEPPEPPLAVICRNARLNADEQGRDEEEQNGEKTTTELNPLSPKELRKGLLQAMFDVASKEDTKEACRKRMYRSWKDASELAEDLYTEAESD